MLFSSRVTLFLLTICLFTGVLVADQRTFGAEMQPLDDILQTEDSVHMTLYALTRCGALYVAVGGLAAQRKDGEIASQFYIDAGTELHMMAMVWAEKNEIQTTMESHLKIAGSIVEAYIERWETNHVTTGHHIGDLTQGDLNLCKEIYETVGGGSE